MGFSIKHSVGSSKMFTFKTEKKNYIINRIINKYTYIFFLKLHFLKLWDLNNYNKTAS